MLASLIDSTPAVLTKYQLGENIDKDPENYLKVNNKPSEIDTKTIVFRRHIVPFFGKLRLDEVSPKGIEQYKSQKLEESYSPKSVNDQLTMIRKMLAVAVE
jgi:hypothetical protein